MLTTTPDKAGSPWTWTVTLSRPMEQDQVVMIFGSMDEACRFAVCHAVRQITHHEWLGHTLDSEWRAGLIVLAKKGLLVSFVKEYNAGKIAVMHVIRIDRTSHEKCDEKDLAMAIQTLEDKYEDLHRVLGDQVFLRPRLRCVQQHERR